MRDAAILSGVFVATVAAISHAVPAAQALQGASTAALLLTGPGLAAGMASVGRGVAMSAVAVVGSSLAITTTLSVAVMYSGNWSVKVVFLLLVGGSAAVGTTRLIWDAIRRGDADSRPVREGDAAFPTSDRCGACQALREPSATFCRRCGVRHLI